MARRKKVNLGTLGPEHPQTGARVEKVTEELGRLDVRYLESRGIMRTGDVVGIEESNFRQEQEP